MATSDSRHPDLHGLDFDTGALRAKYRHERDIRLRPNGQDQYRPAGAAFVADPFVEPGFARAAIAETREVLVVGAGFSGLLMSAHLHKQGVSDVRIVDKAADFGGTWYWNRYPGAACDIESYIYMPLLEEVDDIPDQKYVGQPHLFEHCRAIARRYDLYPRALFQTSVTRLQWLDAEGLWLATTDRQDALKARFVCLAAGAVHQPKLPGLPGFETFGGRMFHTARWDYDYTGGAFDQPLDRLGDKVVGIVGAGATAVQCIPPLARSAKRLYVFQRTPSTVDARNQQQTDPAWAAGLTAGWQARRAHNFDVIVSGGHAEEDLVQDGWTEIFRRTEAAVAEAGPAGRELADFANMEHIRRRIDQLVSDPATAEALKPYYNQMCKRPCFHDGYLETFNRPNVTLVDTHGRGVEAMTRRGVVAEGREYPLDCLIFATGFEMNTSYAGRVGFEIYGRSGLSLSQKWRDGVSTLHGFHVHGFPNCFILTNAQSAGAANLTYVLDLVSQHLSDVIRRCRDEDIAQIEVTAEAEAAWVDEILGYAEARRAFNSECTPGYVNSEGDTSILAVRNNFYGGGSQKFLTRLAEWRADGSMPGMSKMRVG